MNSFLHLLVSTLAMKSTYIKEEKVQESQKPQNFFLIIQSGERAREREERMRHKEKEKERKKKSRDRDRKKEKERKKAETKSWTHARHG
jgi:hypothetical protein